MQGQDVVSQALFIPILIRVHGTWTGLILGFGII